MKTPRPFQIEDGDYIAKRRSALVAHQPRVGKTAIAIRACDLLRTPLVVIVCPANVRDNWRIAVADDFRRGNWPALIVSWNRAAEFLKRIAGRGWSYVLIIDESHYGKNKDAARTIAVYGPQSDRRGGLAEFATNVYCLTGTPLPNDPTELWPMLRAIAPELIFDDRGRPMPYSIFRDKFCRVIRAPFGFKIGGSKNYRDLRKRLEGFSIRRTRREVFGTDILPSTRMYVQPSKEFGAELASLEASTEGRLIKEALDSEEGLERLLKNKELSSKLRRILGLAKVQGLSDQLAEELDADPDMKIVLLCWHTVVIDAYANALRRFGVCVFDGRTGSGERKARINKEFQTKASKRVVVGQILAIGVGLDWSAADTAVFGEPSWNGTDNEQARARVFNMNSDRPKFTRFPILVGGGIDERIIAEAERKLRDAERIFAS